MAKSLFGGVRTQVVGTLVATIGGLALTACNACCPQPVGPAVYRRPCCAQPAGGMVAPMPPPPPGTPMAPPPAGTAPAAPQGGQMSCGGGKCG